MAGRLIEHYRMQWVPEEGVWFALTYLSADRIDGHGRTLILGPDVLAGQLRYRDELQREYPSFGAQIARLTRAAHAHR
jgi:hypothetical protein